MSKIFAVAVLISAFSLLAAERTIDDFSAPGKGSWRTVAKGNNLVTETESGYIDDDGKMALRVEFLQRNPDDKAASGRWFFFDYPLSADPSWYEYDGIAFDIRLDAGSGDYIEPSLLTGGNARFRATNDWAGFSRKEKRPCPEYMGSLSREWTSCRLPFAELRDNKNPEARVNPGKVTAIRLGGGASATVILLRNLRLYREEKAVRSVKQCVEMSVDTNYTGNISNTFQPSQMVKFELKAKDLPADATALNWIVNDYWGRTVASGCIGLTGGEVNLGVMPNGYYETRVFPVNGQGRRISNESVLKTTGTMPKGMQSFAVVPCTYAENIARMEKYGNRNFFGIMNSRHQFKVHELVGAPWYLEIPCIEWYKPAKELAKPPRPSWQQSVFSFRHSIKSNYWYKGGTVNPKIMREGGPDAENYKRFFAEVVRTNVHRHPDAEFRPYELSWEADLSCPPFGKLDINDLVEWWRIISEIVRSNDPKARIWGPKCTNNLPWFEKALAAGIGKYIDEISMHFYLGPVPEDANLPMSLKRIRALCRKYIGRELPINNTEGGYYRQEDVQTQAQKMMRYAIIQKGEGVSHYLLFTIVDFWEFGHIADYGLFYNPTWPLNFGPKQIYPKPLMVAYANLSRLLTGTKVLEKLGDSDDGFFGYAFSRDDGKIVLALWNPYREEEVSLPCAGHGMTVVDIMGVSRYVLAKDGRITLRLTKDPIYIEQAQSASGEPPVVTRLQRAAEFVGAKAETRGKDAVVVLRFANKTGEALRFYAAFESEFGKKRSELSLAAGEEGEACIMLAPAERGFSTASPLKGKVVWRIGKTVYFEKVEIGFLHSFALGEKAVRKGPFSNRAEISGTGADGKKDAAHIEIYHSPQGLHLKVRVDDAVHSQDNDVDSLWRGDSLQIAFDTAPGYAYEYDEAIMQVRKKVSDIVVALGTRGMELYRNKTYSERFLPTGKIDNAKFPGSKIVRQGKQCVYDLMIPWSEIGLDASEVQEGMPIGFSLLVNDHDGEGTKRAYYSLFGGIADESGYNSYGYFNLDGERK